MLRHPKIEMLRHPTMVMETEPHPKMEMEMEMNPHPNSLFMIWTPRCFMQARSNLIRTQTGMIRPRAPCTQHTAQTGPQPLLSLQMLRNCKIFLEGGKGVKERRLQNDQDSPKCQRFFMCLATVGSWRTRTYIDYVPMYAERILTRARGKNSRPAYEESI